MVTLPIDISVDTNLKLKLCPKAQNDTMDLSSFHNLQHRYNFKIPVYNRDEQDGVLLETIVLEALGQLVVLGS